MLMWVLGRYVAATVLYPKSKHWFTTFSFGGRCRKAMLGVCLVPKARSLLGECLFAEHTSDSSTNYDSFLN